MRTTRNPTSGPAKTTGCVRVSGSAACDGCWVTCGAAPSEWVASAPTTRPTRIHPERVLMFMGRVYGHLAADGSCHRMSYADNGWSWQRIEADGYRGVYPITNSWPPFIRIFRHAPNRRPGSTGSRDAWPPAPRVPPPPPATPSGICSCAENENEDEHALAFDRAIGGMPTFGTFFTFTSSRSR